MDIDIFLQSLTVQEKAAIMIKLTMQLQEEKCKAEEMKNLKLRDQPEQTFWEWYKSNRPKMSRRLNNAISVYIDRADKNGWEPNGDTPINDITLDFVRRIRNIGTSSLMEFKKLRGY